MEDQASYLRKMAEGKEKTSRSPNIVLIIGKYRYSEKLSIDLGKDLIKKQKNIEIIDLNKNCKDLNVIGEMLIKNKNKRDVFIFNTDYTMDENALELLKISNSTVVLTTVNSEDVLSSYGIIKNISLLESKGKTNLLIANGTKEEADAVCKSIELTIDKFLNIDLDYLTHLDFEGYHFENEIKKVSNRLLNDLV